MTIFELINLRSFSNIWFWIALAVLWSAASHWVIGVPFDMVVRARKEGGQAQVDLQQLVQIQVERRRGFVERSGPWLVALVCFLLTACAVLGFVYRAEFAQALFLLLLPMTALVWLGLRTAAHIHNEDLEGELLRARLLKHRATTQFLGVVSIFVTALWGMYQNLALGVL